MRLNAGYELHRCSQVYKSLILPGTSPFEDSHYDHFLGLMGHHNVARYSPAVFASDRPDEWQMMLTLGFILSEKRVPANGELAAFEDVVIAGFVSAFTDEKTSSLHRRDVQEIMAKIEVESGVERMLDVGVRAGRFGDHFGRRDGLTLKQMREASMASTWVRSGRGVCRKYRMAVPISRLH